MVQSRMGLTVPPSSPHTHNHPHTIPSICIDYSRAASGHLIKISQAVTAKRGRRGLLPQPECSVSLGYLSTVDKRCSGGQLNCPSLAAWPLAHSSLITTPIKTSLSLNPMEGPSSKTWPFVSNVFLFTVSIDNPLCLLVSAVDRAKREGTLHFGIVTGIASEVSIFSV